MYVCVGTYQLPLCHRPQLCLKIQILYAQYTVSIIFKFVTYYSDCLSYVVLPTLPYPPIGHHLPGNTDLGCDATILWFLDAHVLITVFISYSTRKYVNLGSVPMKSNWCTVCILWTKGLITTGGDSSSSIWLEDPLNMLPS